jgi:hypothetical protein
VNFFAHIVKTVKNSIWHFTDSVRWRMVLNA